MPSPRRLSLVSLAAVMVLGVTIWWVVESRQNRASRPAAGPTAAPEGSRLAESGAVDPSQESVARPRDLVDRESRFGWLSGRVRWEDGAVAEGSRLTLLGSTSVGTKTQRIGQSGEFTFGALVPGDYQLECVDAGAVQAVTRSIQLEANDRQHCELTLERGLSIAGTVRVLAKDGNQVSLRNAELYAFGVDGGLRTGSVRRGDFEISGLRRGSYELVLWSRRLSLIGTTQVSAGARGVRLLARVATGSLVGEVRDAADGGAIPNREVALVLRRTGPQIRRVALGRGVGYSIQAVPEGVYDIEVSGRGYRSETQRGVVVNAATEQLKFDFELTELPDIVGFAYAVTGEPIERAIAYAIGDAVPPSLPLGAKSAGGSLGKRLAPLRARRLGSDGDLWFEGIERFRGIAIAEASVGYVQLADRRLDSPVGPCAVTGRLVGLLGKARQQLVLLPTQGSGSGGALGRVVETHDAGLFLEANLAPGSYDIYVVSSEVALHLCGFELDSELLDLGLLEAGG